MKKILIISLSAGAGHVRAGEALKKQAGLSFKNLEIKHIDMAEYITLPMKKTAIDTYTLMIKKMPELWGFLYQKTDQPKITKKFNSLTRKLKNVNSLKLYDEIQSYTPDSIICTHFLPAEVILNASKKHETKIPVSIVVTDYDLHGLWLVPDTSHFFVATEKIKWKMINRNIPESKITVSGIPIDPCFYEEKSNTTLKNKHEIPLDQKTILVLSGGQGLGKTKKVVKTLFQTKKTLTIIAIAGKNKKLENSLRSLQAPTHIKFIPIGWTNIIDEYMRIADVILTKAGGITTTECTTLNKQIIITDPIPGQEEHNTDYILENNLGVIARSEEDVLWYVEQETPCGEKQKIENAGNIILKELEEED